VKTIKVGIMFSFEPKGEHQDIFEDFSSDEKIIEACKQGETYESLDVWIEERL